MFCNYVALMSATPCYFDETIHLHSWQLPIIHLNTHEQVHWTTTVRTLPPQDSMHQTVSSVTFTASITHNRLIQSLYIGLVLTVQGCWWPRRWARGSPPAARIQCWHHSHYHSLKASSLLWKEQHSHVRNNAAFHVTDLDCGGPSV